MRWSNYDGPLCSFVSPAWIYGIDTETAGKDRTKGTLDTSCRKSNWEWLSSLEHYTYVCNVHYNFCTWANNRVDNCFAGIVVFAVYGLPRSTFWIIVAPQRNLVDDEHHESCWLDSRWLNAKSGIMFFPESSWSSKMQMTSRSGELF